MTDAKPNSTYFRALFEGAPRFFLREPSGGARLMTAAPWLGGSPEGSVLDRASASRLATLCPGAPSKIIGIGRNYRKHAAELGNEVPSEPLMFFKPPSSLLGPGGRVQLPPESSRVDFEAEVAVVIGTRCRRVSSSSALGCVFGYALACDLTARDLQKSDRQWTRAKGFDGFCPLGPEVVSGVDPSNIHLRLTQNGALRQDGTTADMIYPVAELVAYVSASMTLEPGDLILTGTPEGVGPLAPGDDVRISAEGFSELRFSVSNET